MSAYDAAEQAAHVDEIHRLTADLEIAQAVAEINAHAIAQFGEQTKNLRRELADARLALFELGRTRTTSNGANHADC
ncbi:hypothetical protein [Nocardia brasiliensis]|uniref:hypothetical protein n=1 Tax=Nocardia brasiliensis TaxID=37326 RepID=UPI00366F0F54